MHNTDTHTLPNVSPKGQPPPDRTHPPPYKIPSPNNKKQKTVDNPDTVIQVVWQPLLGWIHRFLDCSTSWTSCLLRQHGSETLYNTGDMNNTSPSSVITFITPPSVPQHPRVLLRSWSWSSLLFFEETLSSFEVQSVSKLCHEMIPWIPDLNQ